MSKRPGWAVGVVATAVLLLAGCSTDTGGGRLTVGGPTTTPRSAAASTGAAASAEPSPASATVSMSIPAGATPGAAGEGNPYGIPTDASAPAAGGPGGPTDGGSTEGGSTDGGSGATPSGLDDTSVVWFETLCQGLAPLPGQEQQALAATDIGAAATALSEATATVTGTAGQLNQLAPPTVDGGPALASAAVQGLTDFGQTLSDFGARAADLPAGDGAGFQQFNADLQSALASTAPLGDAKPAPDLAAQVRSIPGCETLFGS